MFGSKSRRRKRDERDLEILKNSVRGLLTVMKQFLDYVNNIINNSGMMKVNAECVMVLMSYSTMMKSYIDIYVNNKFARPGLSFSIEQNMAKIDESISSIKESLTKMHEYAFGSESMLYMPEEVLEMGRSLGEIKSYLRLISLSIHQDNIRIDCGVDIIQEYYDNIKDLKKFYQPPSSSKYVIQFTYNDTFKKKEEDKHEQ